MLRGGAQDILAGRIQGKPEEVFGARINAYDLGFCVILCDLP